MQKALGQSDLLTTMIYTHVYDEGVEGRHVVRKPRPTSENLVDSLCRADHMPYDDLD